MSQNEPSGGFDRRSLIKKGLVAGGIVATAPVISTFNSAAFAQSLNGVFVAQFTVTVLANGQIGTITRVAEDTVGGCSPEIPNFGIKTPAPAGDVTGAPSGGGTTVAFSAIGDCVFTDAAADNGPGNPDCFGSAPFSPFGTNPITFTPPASQTNPQSYRIRLEVTC